MCIRDRFPAIISDDLPSDPRVVPITAGVFSQEKINRVRIVIIKFFFILYFLWLVF